MSNQYQDSPIKLFSLSSNPALAEEVAANLGMELGKSVVEQFSDGEIQIHIEESIRGADVYVIQSTSDPVNHHIIELLIMIDALKRSSPQTINVVIPYYGYARQDRKASPREPIAAKLVADLLQRAGATRIISLDLHASQIQGFFNIPVDQLAGIPLLSDYFNTKQLSDVVIVSPDHGSATRARQMADRMNAPIAIVDKRRSAPNGVEETDIVGNVEGKTAIIIDDIVDTGTRITQGTQALIDHGAKQVYACSTHPVLSGLAIEKLQASPLKELVVTNSIPIYEEKRIAKITQLSIAPLLSEAITRVHEQKSVSILFD
ncbi:ribose-phosphate diphosphokinase [Radiobacillus sp. PE A8.2]|uniref:ribose-phosphate diphosphokinase n=1 Tax=Radiobacillus sp. PE A8.2 TaxID=3380349 RepID=UPI00388E64FC